MKVTSNKIVGGSSEKWPDGDGKKPTDLGATAKDGWEGF